MKESMRRMLHPVTRRFLYDHPEWEDEVVLARVEGELKVAFTVNCSLAFAAWLKENGGDVATCDDFLKNFEKALAEQLGGSNV